MASSESGKSAGTMMFIIVTLLLTLVGAGAGFAVGSILQTDPANVESAPSSAQVSTSSTPESSSHAEKSEAPAHSAAEEGSNATDEPIEDEPKDVKILPFPPVLTNLAVPKEKWIRLEGSLVTRSETEETPEVLAEKAGEQILTYLRTVKLNEIEGPSGMLALREDLNEMVQVLSAGQVRGVLIHSLVVE